MLKEASDFQASTVTQYQVATYLRDNRWMTRMDESRRVTGKVGVMQRCRQSEEFFPADVQYTRPEGGYFIWLTVPGINTTEMFLPRDE